MELSINQYQLLAKQTIFDADKEAYASELLFRSPMSFSAQDVGEELATHQVLANYCSSIIEAQGDETSTVFINVDEQFLKNYDSLPVSADTVVIEMNVRGSVDVELLGAAKKWSELGFKLSLGSYDFSGPMKALLPFCSYVKVDIRHVNMQQLALQLQEELKLSDATWVAERIETEALFDQCRLLGFKLFQGYFLARPKDVRGSSIRPGTATTLRIIQELERDNISMDQIAELVSQDPKLAVQMVKIINSSLFALPKPVTDLKSALVFLGVDMLRHWAMILAFLSNGSIHLEACRLVLLRAKSCELMCLSDRSATALGPAAFLSGLVSGVDVLIGVTPELFLSQVELAPEVVEAVTKKRGVLGNCLAIVLDLEERIAQEHFSLSEVTPLVINAYREADAWVDQVLIALKS